MATLFSHSYTFGLFFLLGCVKEQVYNQSMNMLGDLKSWFMAAIVNVAKDALTVRPAVGRP
jgi:hypothetical protein